MLDSNRAGARFKTSSIEPNRALTLKHRTDPSRPFCSDRLDRLPSLTRNSGPQNDEPGDDDDDSDNPTAFETSTEECFHQIELFQQDMYTRLVEGFDELKRTTRTSPPASGPLANNTQPIPSTPRLPYVATGAPQLSGTPLCP